ncbi:hypothetical protein O3M35_006210 [Rhynocoris fuscipes]|uniref:BED-type domain-containing protein n=1 Tax=Rhynocoris fuscipes TaxID=488301 RepID=A0AAW1DF05_9HEMI
MDSKVKQVYVHKAPTTLKVEHNEYSPVVEHSSTTTILHYKRLVVPSNMRSIYWKCYGFPANDENEILTRTKIVCLLCKATMTYNRNTTNLRMHLQNKHKNELVALEMVQSTTPTQNRKGEIDRRLTKKARKSNSSRDSVVQVFPLNSPQQTQISHCEPTPEYIAEVDDMNPLSVIVKEATSNQSYTLVDGKAIADAIAEFIILDMQNPEIVEGRGFQRLIGTLKSPCEIPSKIHLTEELIPKIYDVVKEQLYVEISSLSAPVSLSIEDWISSSGDLYSTVSIHFISFKEIELQNRVLSTIYCSEVDALHWGAQFDVIIEEYQIKLEKITAVVVASDRADVYDSLVAKGLTILPCFSFAMQSACTGLVFGRDEVQEVLRKCRALIAHISRNSTATAELRLQDNLLQLEDSPLIADTCGGWMSTLTMLEQIQARRNILPSVIDCLSSTICPTTSLELNSEEWKLLDDVVSVLSPFKVTTATLMEEKSPLISILKPILSQLLNVHLQRNESDSEFAVELKTTLYKVLQERYENDKVKEMLDLSSALDPRFKSLPFMTENERTVVKKKIQTLVQDQVGNSTDTIENSKMGLQSKKRLSGMEFLLGELCTIKSEMPTRQRADLEHVQYEWESQADLEKSPIEWWREMNGKCYHISNLANVYLCVPVCVRAHLQNTFTPNTLLQSLPIHLALKLKFLHMNYFPGE